VSREPQTEAEEVVGGPVGSAWASACEGAAGLGLVSARRGISVDESNAMRAGSLALPRGANGTGARTRGTGHGASS